MHLLVQQILSWNSNIIKRQLGVVNPIQTHLVSHIFYSNTWHRLQLIITNTNQNTMDAMVLTPSECLSEHYAVLSMLSSICNPISLQQECKNI